MTSRRTSSKAKLAHSADKQAFGLLNENHSVEGGLVSSEAELRALFASMHDAVMVIDRDGLYRKIAPTNPSLLFKPMEELLGKNLREIFPAEQADAFIIAIRRVLDTQQPERIEYELQIGERMVWFATYISPMNSYNTLWVARDITERKLAEAAQRESEERYHSLFDRMMDGVYRSTHEGRFVDINPAMVKMFGYSSREEMMEVDIKHDLYFSPEERGSHVLDTGKEEIEAYRMRRKDGSEIWVEDHGAYVHDEQGGLKYHEGILRDITERKQKEDALIKLQKAVDSSKDAIFLTDIHGVFTYVNPAFIALYGFQADELIGKVTPRVIKSGLTDPQVYELFWRKLTSGQEVTGELINKRMDGTFITVEGSATPIFDDVHTIIGFLGVQRDVTERKKSEEALRIAEANYRSIYENATIGIYQSIPQGIFLSVNPVMAQTFGYDSPQDMTRSIVSITDQYYADPVDRQRFERLMIEQGEVREFVSQNFRKNGEQIWVQENARAVKDEQGNILYYEGFVTDITERKRSEDDLYRAKDSLETTHRELQELLAHTQLLARTDGLTGLYNFRYFFELASYEFTAAIRYQRPLSIIIFDTDKLKEVNDTLGHVTGDKMLVKVAQAASLQVRSVDALARYGGDEFVVLLPQTNAQQAFPVAERIRASVAALRIETERGPLAVTLSIGIAELSIDPRDQNLESIVQRADKALYSAKAAGRNCTKIFHAE
ncbi:MAG: PAS domain S-box protein [Anaerolineales bacterium]|nr:PAS domain S-box protein [Anaerolineales bacterium]